MRKFERDVVLNDLRAHVCEIFFKDNSGNQLSVRCSLRHNVLPESYALTEEQKEREFHEKNPDIISAWDIMNGGWKQFHIDSITYIQIIDTI